MTTTTTEVPSALMDGLAVEVAVDFGLDSDANGFGGYDFALPGRQGCTLRLTQEDPQGGVEVFLLPARGVLLMDMRFSAGVPEEVVVAAVAALVGRCER